MKSVPKKEHFSKVSQLGFGFLESVYEKAMIIELTKDDLQVEAEKPLKLYYDDQVIGDFYVDLFVEEFKTWQKRTKFSWSITSIV